MNGSEKIETSGAKDRIKNIFTLAVFTVFALIASIVTMDIIVYPITIFAVKETALFNSVIKYGFFSTITGLLILKIFRRILSLKREGLTLSGIVKYLLKRPRHYAGVYFAFLIISAVVISIIYLLLSYNYYMLYKITGA